MVADIILIGLVISALVILVTRSPAQRRKKGAPVLPPQIRELGPVDQENYVLLQRALRVLDRQVNDDMVAVVMPEEMQVEIDDLLSDYYGNRTRLNRRKAH